MNIIIDYGLGNIRSVEMALRKLGYEPLCTSDPDDIKIATSIVLPGVGAFGKAMTNLKKMRLLDPLISYLKEGKPYLGICLGLQILFSYSREHGENEGLKIISGGCERIVGPVRVPHIGWNNVRYTKIAKDMFSNIPQNSYYYFDHSYCVKPNNKDIIAGETIYGGKFVSAIIQGQIWGVQFHPEKSAEYGLSVLSNFMISAGCSC